MQDRAGLASVLEEAIEKRHGGNRNAAAKITGIPYNTLKRYLEREGASIRHETLERFRKMVGAARIPRIEAALFSPHARKILTDYDTDLRNEQESIIFGATGTKRFYSLEPNTMHAEIEGASALERSGTVESLIAYLRRKYPKEWAPLVSRLRKRGHFNARAKLAFLRVIAPLTPTVDVPGVERSLEELSDKEIRELIRAGVARERIMLDRETDIKRAQELAAAWQRPRDGSGPFPPSRWPPWRWR